MLDRLLDLQRFFSVELAFHNPQRFIFLSVLIYLSLRVIHLLLHFDQSSLVDIQGSLEFLVILFYVFDFIRQRVTLAELIFKFVYLLIEIIDLRILFLVLNDKAA